MESCHQNSDPNSSCSVVKYSSSKSVVVSQSQEKLPTALETKSVAVPDYVRVLMVTDVNGRTKQLQVPAALDLLRPKRPRTTFTEKQVEALELEFLDNHFVSQVKRQRLSASLNLSQTQIKVWYQNRRSKCHRLGCTHQGKGSSSFSSSSTFLESVDERHMSWTRGNQADRFSGEYEHCEKKKKKEEPTEEAMKTKEKLATTLLPPPPNPKMMMTTHPGFHPWNCTSRPELVQFPRLQIWSSSISLSAPLSLSYPQPKSVT